jgi:hypothetical protein
MSKKNHSNNSNNYLIGQMSNFKCEESYYSTKYSCSYFSPKTWWKMVEDPNDFLKSLALKLFSITPHSAACERAFSMLGFLYGKRRQCLSISTIEMLAKIRYYLMSNIRNELNHLTNEESELKVLIQECGFFDEDNDIDDLADENYDDTYYDDELLSSREVYVLIVNEVIDLNNPVFTGDFAEVHNNSSDDEFLGEGEEEEELDIESLAKISAPPNM